jgi:hypothetical protein
MVVRAAACGSARDSVCLFVFNNYIRLNLSRVRFECNLIY